MFGPLKIAQYLRICESIQNSKILSSIINPLAAWAQNAAGYRKLGLKYDDLLMDDTEIAQEALARLPRSVLNDRVYRFRTAFQLSIQQTELPQEKWITPKTVIFFK
ncbi:Cytochrome b-c1 complex subunit 7 [Coelomomyces lativittatus]|nr:Cytochrome b-c1 complex subunit 7 [Coelomomyces lativittatus]